MITLTLLHPLKSIPVQKWNFEPDSVIRVGRAHDNNVILYSAVVSRHHVEIRSRDTNWVLINKGSNGTFINGKKVNKVLVKDGLIFRLASSGPKIQIKLNGSEKSLDQEKQVEEEFEEKFIDKKDISKETVISQNN